ncbi:MAG: C_GCAxxG_C_C family protein [Firmicutes bacterium]|nr:C_GCAxxG_C_C family protein [Bacillota bacterium]
MSKMTEEKANELMDAGYHCSQVLAYHVAEELGLDKAEWLKLTSGLGGGCNHGDTCGAITGAIIGLGAVYGFCEENYSEEKDEIIKEKVKELQERFIEKHGSVLCRDLLDGYDNADPNSESSDDTWDNCGMYCADAAVIWDEIVG